MVSVGYVGFFDVFCSVLFKKKKVDWMDAYQFENPTNPTLPYTPYTTLHLGIYAKKQHKDKK